MKKKILLVLLTALLAVGIFGTLGVSALESEAEGQNAALLAEEEPSLKFVGAALVLDNTIKVRYLVNAENVASINDVKLLVWNGAPEEYKKGTEDYAVSYKGAVMSYGGVQYPCFDFEGAGAKKMTDDFYSVVYVKTAAGEFYSAPNKYSILNYAYNKLGKTGTISTNANLIELLNTMLAYGAASQKYLNYKTDRLATDDFYQVKVTGGVLDDGFSNGLYLEGEKPTVTAPFLNAEKQIFSHWKNAAGEAISTEKASQITVGTQNIALSAVYKDCVHVGSWVKDPAPTCISGGTKTLTCSVCMQTVTENLAIDPYAHNYEDGVCTDCGKVQENTPTIPIVPGIHNHTWGELILTNAPTCTETGLKTAKCQTCTETFTIAVGALGHEYGEEYIATEDGHVKECLRNGCGYVTETEAHSGGSASCSKLAECEFCGASYGEYEDHDFGDWVLENEPACNEEGNYIRTCNSCSATETKGIPTTDHNFENGFCTMCGLTSNAPGEGEYDTPFVPADDEE